MKVLLLSGIPPSTNLTAGLVLDKLCRFLPPESIACYSVVPPWLEVRVPDALRDMPQKRGARPQEKAYRPLPGALGSMTAFLRESYNQTLPLSRLVNDAVEFGRAWGAEALWCVLEGQTLIRMAAPVAKGLGVPLFTQVWDPPQWWMRHNQIDAITSAATLKAYDSAITYSTACGAASWAMAEEYEKLYGTRSVAIPPGLDEALAFAPAVELHPGNEFIIGMAGQLYAEKEWNALLAALHKVDWVIGGRNVRIDLLGRYANLRAEGRTNIRFLGWAAQTDTIRIMSECDVNYCAYWFDSEFEREARLSFPGKLSTYLAAGRPVLFHGPEYASPSRFLAKHEAGMLCHSLEPDAILATLNRLAGDKEHYKALAVNGTRAYRQYLTLDAMRLAFFDFLGMRETAV